MKKVVYLIPTVLLGFVSYLTIIYAKEIFSILVFPKKTTVLGQLEIFTWVGAGVATYLVLSAFIQKNLKWLETFSHELTHIVVSLFFLRKVHSFHAEEEQGVVYTSGGFSLSRIPVSLAPYCLPIFTYLLLAIRCLIMKDTLWIYDILIGMTIAFHVKCFIHQTGNYQPDINQFPLFFSYLYIGTALLINTLVIIVSFFPQYNVYTSFWRLISSCWLTICNII